MKVAEKAAIVSLLGCPRQLGNPKTSHTTQTDIETPHLSNHAVLLEGPLTREFFGFNSHLIHCSTSAC